MNRVTLVLTLLAGIAIGIGAAVGFLSGHRGDAPALASAAPEKTVLYWYDPMVPNQHFEQPGKSPFMDMPLVPKYADGAGDAGTVRIEPRLVQNLGVRTARATRGTLASPVRATGTVAFDESAVSLVQARVAGIVEALAVRTPLASVSQGQPLLTLIAPEWTAAQAEYLSLRQSRSAGLEELRAAARQRLLLLGMTEGQIRGIEQAGQAQARITVTAPRAGVVSELLVRDGASVMAGTPLVRLNGLDTVWVQAAIPEAQVGRIAAGSPVTLELPAFPGESMDGTIAALLPDLDPATRTLTARIVAANPTHRLAPGMFARVTIAARSGAAQSVTVPTEAVIATGRRQVVIVDAGDGRFRAQEVRIGDEGDGQTAVLEGLDEGDTVVLSGQFLIDSEASLTGTLARLDAPASTSSAANAAPATYTAEGTVKRIDGATWSVATEAIAALDMPAMTMSFVLPASVPNPGIGPGQRVRLTFARNAEGDFEIVTVAALPTAGAP